ncbi:hypothetical protein [Pedobacter alluvionis]|uniref:Uncharacterized protein n=1 Tax=Pedobacter alluvionis TaxID=475253 RepID=A0A497YC76_9SPHI|nr:hypothetical protein [Pedobacter alluvionis]RLJ80511.1 hypothetical protein BCL90_1292 [Pedobacter alluvionis]TFB31782.1 hypothetical protein E3V97_14475 [Pedobacter alluvionis]
MPDHFCLYGPPFTLSGEVYFSDNNISFQVDFSNPADQQNILAYEWYLNDTLVIDERNAGFTGKVYCGGHKVGVRVLSSEGWSGIKSHSFYTCKAPLAIIIQGPDFINEGESGTYLVLQQLSDNTVEDLTSKYTFTINGGASFNGNVLTTIKNEGSFSDETLTITATPVTGNPVTKEVTVKNTTQFNSAVLVVDLFNDTSLNVIGLIDNPEVTVNHQPVYTGNNFLPVSVIAENAYMLASDLIPGSATNWRFEFNLAKLITQYPNTTDFVFYIKGRGAADQSLSGAFSLKTKEAKMIMSGGTGSYVPDVVGGNTNHYTNFTTYVAKGANGSYLEENLRNIIRFNYNFPSDTLTFTAEQIIIPDFDYMAVRYHWLQGAGKDLDIFVGFEQTGTPFDGMYVGFGGQNRTVPHDTVPPSDAYLWWASDNRGLSGIEAVLIGMKKFVSAQQNSTNIIQVGLYAIWYDPVETGDFSIELVTYKGGTMQLVDTNFVNDGGVQVSNDTIALNTMKHSKSGMLSNYFKLGSLVYNKTTKTATLNINNSSL